MAEIVIEIIETGADIEVKAIMSISQNETPIMNHILNTVAPLVHETVYKSARDAANEYKKAEKLVNKYKGKREVNYEQYPKTIY
ncbi:hypothetical protein QNS55_23960 [Klebsiella pneumoniae]|uniref:hypothetical protein n=1 Tax=Klebsiella pneumoniae TaxID=573 RepID=UPI003447A0F7